MPELEPSIPNAVLPVVLVRVLHGLRTQPLRELEAISENLVGFSGLYRGRGSGHKKVVES
jgi:hypothetical protein